MKPNLDQFNHIYINNNAEKTLFLLHGTGGDENNFLFLDEPLNKQYNLVGIRGNINENGANRFFKRYNNNPFLLDQTSIKTETQKLHQFFNTWNEEYNLRPEDSTFLGYSNGANMLLAMLFYFPDTVKNLVLLHCMLPFLPTEQPDLTNHRIFISYGSNDEIIPADKSRKAIYLLSAAKADMTVKEYQRGHEISRDEVNDVVEFLKY